MGFDPNPPDPLPQQGKGEQVPPFLERDLGWSLSFKAGVKLVINSNKTFSSITRLTGEMAYHTNPRLGYPIYSGAEPEILKLARENRKHSTPAERKLWEFLRKHKIMGMKFRRQHPVLKFIADFYCHQAKLIIEIDGGYHDDQEQEESDQCRQKELEDIGLHVLRFRNEEIEMDVEGVVERIREVLCKRV